MTEGKRRGRPPGVKNRPKNPDDQMALPGADKTFSLSKAPDIEPEAIEPSWAVSAESLPPLVPWPRPGGITVVVNFKVAMSSAGITETVDWPSGWPIPQLNDVIRTKENAGRVQWVEYDQGAGVIRISTN